MRLVAGAFVATLLLVVSGCAGGGEDEARAPTTSEPAYSFPDPTIVIDRPLEQRVDGALSQLLPEAAVGILDPELLNVIGDSPDARLGWLVSDLLRFYQGSVEEGQLVTVFERLTGSTCARIGTSPTGRGES